MAGSSCRFWRCWYIYAVGLSANGNGSTSGDQTSNSQILTLTEASTLGIIENSFGNKLIVYPNPTHGNLSIDLGKKYNSIRITITDLNQKLIFKDTYKDSQLLNLEINASQGIYLLNIESKNKKATLKVIKK